jgi:type II secretory pathway pseudopilin PulG
VKKIIIMAIVTTSVLQSCMKQDLKVSDEVLVSITNECRAQIKLYNYEDGRQYLSDIFDCSYVSILPIKVKPGKYKIKAETYQGKSVTKTFTKGVYAQTLDIEF